jgi:hypothetical protein
MIDAQELELRLMVVNAAVRPFSRFFGFITAALLSSSLAPHRLLMD